MFAQIDHLIGKSLLILIGFIILCITIADIMSPNFDIYGPIIQSFAKTVEVETRRFFDTYSFNPYEK